MRYSLLSNTKNWMSCIDDSKSLAHISIPGTHNSCARRGASGQLPIVDNFVATQNRDDTITKQLEDGIRYLDIRCCAINGVFAIHHGKFYLNINFGDVLKECISFLEKNSSETIIMRIKKENSSISDMEFLDIFNTHYAGYHGSMYLESSIPTIGKVRGKIVILSNVLLLPGIPYGSISVQDDSTDTSVSSKSEKVCRFAEESAKSNRNGSNTTIYLNYCSANNPPWENPWSFASNLLPIITSDFKKGLGADQVNNSKNEAPHIGIIAMDYYTSDLIAEIIKRNENKHFYNLPVYSIYNTYYGQHYFYASLYMDSKMKKRQVFGWNPGNKVANGYWVLIPLDKSGNRYYIFNTYYKEFLYASTFITDNRRDVFTWVDGVPTEESIWTVGSNYIYNEYYGCYLYESSLSFSENRKLTPCWAPGNRVLQDKWHLDYEDNSVG